MKNLLCALFVVFFSPLVFGHSCTVELLPLPGEVTHEALSTGNWGNAANWSAGTVPGAGAVVVIPPGVTITIDGPYLAELSKLAIYGTLSFLTTGNGELSLDTLLVPVGGELIMGQDGAPIAAANRARITIFDAGTGIDVIKDPAVIGRGIIADGTILMNGTAKTPFLALTGDALVGATTLALVQAPTGWNVGDEIVIPATTFSADWAANLSPPNSMLQNEVRTITAINAAAKTVTFATGLAYNHQRAESSEAIHVANLSRNVIIQSESVADITRRGHVMACTNACTIRNALFLRMGRTDKLDIVTDPFAADGITPLTGSANARGRYGLHFHKGGTDIALPPAEVTGCVVRDTPGWGFVSHSSYVDFVDNVCYDFVGGGFVTEDGDEAGSFINNIAIGGTGNGEFPEHRTIFNNQPRMDQGDMAFTGEGFWFQGPDLTVIGNIAAGCKGGGYMFWCGGRLDPLVDHYTGFPRSRVPTGVVPRSWSYDSNRVLVADIPVRSFSNNVAYGCFTGLKFRYVNHGNNNVYINTRAGYENEIVLAPGYSQNTQAKRKRYTISDNLFWNTLNGLHATYAGTVTFTNLQLVCADTSGSLGGIGVDCEINAGSHKYNNLRIKNYLTGIWHNAAALNETGTTMTGVTQPYFDNDPNYPLGYTAKNQTFGTSQ